MDRLRTHSSPRIHRLLVMGAFALAPLVLPAAGIPSFAECQANYRRGMERINTNQTVATEAGKAYGKAVDALTAEFKKKGDYDNTLLLMEEQKRFASQKTVPPEDPSSPVRSYENARRQYRATMANAERVRNEQRVALLRPYTKTLRDILLALLKADKMTEGEPVNAEVKRAEAELKSIEAALQASAPAAATPVEDTTARTPATTKPADAVPDKAQITQYNDSDAFIVALNGANAPTGTLKRIDFGSGIHGRGKAVENFNTSKGFTLEGVRFTAVIPKGGFAMSILRPSTKDYLHDGWNDSPTVLCGPPDGSVVVLLPAEARAVAFNVYTASDTESHTFGQDVRVTLASNNVFTVHTGYKPAMTFVGFISTVPLKTARIEAVAGLYSVNLAAFMVK